jgi:hypothetical protein
MTVYRTDDKARWDAGKGSNITPAEVDLNFWGVIQRLISDRDQPAVGRQHRHHHGRR